MKAFTLIESLITIAIFTIVLGGLFGLVWGSYRILRYNFQQSTATSEARNGINTMLKEIREAQPGADGSYIIEEANDYEFIFHSDINGDGKIERVRYFLDGSDFKKGVTEPTGYPPIYNTSTEIISIISKYVRNQPPIFRYFDGNMQELSTPTRLKDTKLMRVHLVINVDPNKPPYDFTLESEVQLRNLKVNL